MHNAVAASAVLVLSRIRRIGGFLMYRTERTIASCLFFFSFLNIPGKGRLRVVMRKRTCTRLAVTRVASRYYLTSESSQTVGTSGFARHDGRLSVSAVVRDAVVSAEMAAYEPVPTDETQTNLISSTPTHPPRSRYAKLSKPLLVLVALCLTALVSYKAGQWSVERTRVCKIQKKLLRVRLSIVPQKCPGMESTASDSV